MAKRFILNADDFGVSQAANRAVEEAYSYGLLKSVSITANGEAFDEAVDQILARCPNFGVGVHLNLTDGKSLCSDVDLLTDSEMKFNNSYLKLLLKAYNPKETEFLSQVEREFRRQIEKVLAKTKATHIDSHAHIHSIPKIFDIVCRLAKEYEIPQVRTHFEKFYFVPELGRHLSWRYYLNFSKKFVLNLMTVANEHILDKYELSTNDYIIGTSYALSMDAPAVMYGIKAIDNKKVTVEAFIHPHRYEEGTIDNYFNEYLITRNRKLAEMIANFGYDITNYKIAEEKQDAQEPQNVQEEPPQA